MTAMHSQPIHRMPNLVIPALATLLLVTATLAPPAEATKPLAQETELVCTACHDKPGSILLTDRGKYFETQRSLVGFAQVMEEFGACTHCHSRKPGSMELTEAGEEFRHQKAVDDMKELCGWLDDRIAERQVTADDEDDEPSQPDEEGGEEGEATDASEDTEGR